MLKRKGEKMKDCGYNHDFDRRRKPFNSWEVRDSGSFGNTVKVDVVVQERTCKICNYVESHKVREGKLNSRTTKNPDKKPWWKIWE